MAADKDIKFDPADMPDKNAFEQKEIYQHPQPADQGTALNKNEKKDVPVLKGKEKEKTSKEEGLNEQKSAGNAGPFEGFEDQQKD